MSSGERTETTAEQTAEQRTAEQQTREHEVAQREQVAALRRAAALREATARAFETRTERWQQVGLASEIDQAASRKALREAFVLILFLVGVLFVFANRTSIPFIVDNELLKATRYVTAALLVLIGWGLARTVAKGLAPALLRRMDPATAGTVGFLIRLFTIVAVIFGSLAIAGVEPETLAVGGAFTAVVVGLAAQQTLGNVIAGAVLLSTRPFRVGDLVALQGSGITTEGTIASLGLFYTTMLQGRDRVLIPNSVLMNIAVMPQGEPDAVELVARFDSSRMTPAALQERLDAAIEVPLVRPPDIELEEIDADGLISLVVSATPLERAHGPVLASQVLAAIRAGGGEGAKTDPRGEPAVPRASARSRRRDPNDDPGYGDD